MNTFTYILPLLLLSLLFTNCKLKQNNAINSSDTLAFAKEMVEFQPNKQNPLFSGTNNETWDKNIRERGFILSENGSYKMWYTGYTGNDNDPKYLGLATSKDGINWVRDPNNPIFSQKWTEDMFVIKYEGKYYMYAEGKNDIAHLLISDDGINWCEQGDLVILTEKGDPIPGPYGTPSVLIEDGKWYLIYERNDEALWLATSTDKKNWTNIQDEPILKKGPEAYDKGAVACNQVVKFKGKYYMYYHGSTDVNWALPGANSLWTSSVAMSTDLIHWTKYPKNPIVEGDHSSPIIVSNGDEFCLYTMHNEVWRYNAK
ncbi:MAG: glycosylase [Bacteroidetes bacterium GWF2_42_66]|nr:MAG: glycosylase [Bacteroidetes bacterium GWA2_42_15]OFY03303.1 MAG: glycosylase [Bacteroidetes bacterium GWE2_42_39]OFY45647.1 MAG: glycosylase [Bacteroidetes bacterium GWF2_42_66]HBL77372.1 glycosylase [Prolixibacteraceae bacterium]HCU62530.1 glycosylase [Prolixibacteraceae bacterium]